MIELGFGDINSSSGRWTTPACRTRSLRVLGDTATAIPELTNLCVERVMKDASLRERSARRAADVKLRHDGLFSRWERESREDWDASPITLPRLAHELWDAIKTEDWVLTACTLQGLGVASLWDFDQAPIAMPGARLGTGTQIGVSLGVAAGAPAAPGRIVVDIQPDGDLMFDVGALWTAAKNNIPLLIVMFNNRAYYNDWEHQIHVAHQRDYRRRPRPYRPWTSPGRSRTSRSIARALRLVRRRADHRSERDQGRAGAGDRQGEGGAAGAGRYGVAAKVITELA